MTDHLDTHNPNCSVCVLCVWCAVFCTLPSRLLFWGGGGGGHTHHHPYIRHTRTILSKPKGMGGDFGKHRSWAVHAIGHHLSEAMVGLTATKLLEVLLPTSEVMLEAVLPTSQAIIGNIASNIGSVFPDRFREAGVWDAQAEGKSVAPLGGDAPGNMPY